MRTKPRWYRFRLADPDYPQCVISDGLPYGVCITVEHNLRFRKGAPIVNRLARKIVAWLKEQQIDAEGR